MQAKASAPLINQKIILNINALKPLINTPSFYEKAVLWVVFNLMLSD
jgi:hypothetical protein